MVQRVKDKAKRPAAGRTKEQASPAPAAASGDARIKALEQERDRLKAELEEARQRIAALEESRSAVASRIDWVIESLSGAVDRND
jgi:predicted  nucleic acid-binding Zn-ribbon protein